MVLQGRITVRLVTGYESGPDRPVTSTVVGFGPQVVLVQCEVEGSALRVGFTIIPQPSP